MMEYHSREIVNDVNTVRFEKLIEFVKAKDFFAVTNVLMELSVMLSRVSLIQTFSMNPNVGRSS